MSEIKTSKITDITGTRKWEGDKGTVWYFDLVMENGDVGSIGKKSQDALKIGQELRYTSELGKNGRLNFREYRENNGFSGRGGFGGRSMSTQAMALAYAKDLVVAQIEAGKTGELKTDKLADVAMAVADKFNTWIKDHE